MGCWRTLYNSAVAYNKYYIDGTQHNYDICNVECLYVLHKEFPHVNFTEMF